MIHYATPEWIATLFSIFIPLPFILLSFLAKKGAPSSEKQNSYFWRTLGFYACYLIYIYVASVQGFFSRVSLPPTVLLLTTFPYAFFLFVIVAKSDFYKNIFEKIALQDLVKIHIFRLLGVFFILLALHDALPKAFAWIAGMGDIITAVTSIFVAQAIVNQNVNAQKWTKIWNIFGAIDIMFTAVAANVLTKISIDTGAMGVDTLARFPFCIIPAFAPPTILFLHYVIFKKMKSGSMSFSS